MRDANASAIFDGVPCDFAEAPIPIRERIIAAMVDLYAGRCEAGNANLANKV